jgi:hypothetical protein
MFDRVYSHNFITLSKEVRAHLVKVFGINRTGITEIRDNTVIADGHTNEDLMVITAPAMSAYTGSSVDDTSFARLWEITISKVNHELNPPTVEVGFGEIVPTIIKYCETCVSTKGRHRKGCPKFK